MPVTGVSSAATADPVASLVAALTAATAALSSRQVIAGSGLSGGGTLAADRTFAVDYAALNAVYASLNPAASSYTYNSDGTVATETVAGVTTTYTYNADGTVHTMVRSGVTRTLTYNADGTVASVA